MASEVDEIEGRVEVWRLRLMKLKGMSSRGHIS